MNKQQLNRLIFLIGELRKNRFPNANTFTETLARASESDSRYQQVSTKTFNRDISLLKSQFKAPIDYCAKERGFYLKHSGWEFEIPWLDEPEVVDVALAGKIANDILPSPLKNRIDSFQNQILSRHSADFFELSLLDSFIINWGEHRLVSNEVFGKIFEAWKNRHRLSMVYQKSCGSLKEYVIEPHVINFNNNTWYIVGYKLPSKERRTFAIQRVREIECLKETFENDRKLIQDVHEKGPYYEPDIFNVKLLYSGNMRSYAKETYSAERITVVNDGDLLVEVPYIRQYDLENHILISRGEVRIIDKPELSDSIEGICKNVIASL